MVRKNKLELTWIGKDERPRLEPRILIEESATSYHASHRVGTNDIFDNRIIFGDNLLALKALEQEFTGMVKCIYIDPPYNTGAAFEHYDDGIEHSLWLGLMRDRITVLHRLLSDSGCFFVQADDNEGHYLKVLCDEIFGRQNFIATFLWKKVDSPNDNKVAVTPDHEFIFAYAKSARHAEIHQKMDETLLEAYTGPDESGRYYRDRLLKKNGKSSLRSDRPSMWFTIPGPDGKDVYPVHDDGREARWALGKDTVFDLLKKKEILWKNRGTQNVPKWVPYTREYANEAPSRPFPTLWTDLPTTRQTKAHQKELFGIGNEFATPKPESLIERILQLSSNPGDLVLDSFAGSGTSGAVAHKMGRRWIMIELGEHCHTHIIPRMKKVIDGQDPGGITEAVGWKGGGGFRYYRLAPSLLEKDKFENWVISKQFNPAMLAEAMCKLCGFTYAPSDTVYWQHGHSTENDFIYVTTQTLTREQLTALSEEVGSKRSLLICCGAFRGKSDAFPNLTLKKIPKTVMDRCEWGRDDYSLQISSLPEAPAEPEKEDIPVKRSTKGSAKETRRKKSQMSLFGEGGA